MKIYGNTVGTTLPKPSFDQTDPSKGDYIRGDRSFTKGDKGDDGKDGADGYTPVKGVDYFTQADKEELTGAVLEELPLTVTDDGYTDISGLRRVTGAAIHEGTDKATVTLTLEGGITEGYEITWDENGYPAKITRGDGSVCSFVWTADAPVEEVFDGILFDGGSAVTWLDGSGAQVSGASLSGSASVVSAYGDYFHTEEMIDLTDFDTLKVRFTAANDNNTFAVSETVSTLAADFAASQIVTAAGEAELDISALTGDYYIMVLSGTPMTGSTSTFTADKVWLE